VAAVSELAMSTLVARGLPLHQARLLVLTVRGFTIGHVLEEQSPRPGSDELAGFDMAAFTARHPTMITGITEYFQSGRTVDDLFRDCLKLIIDPGAVTSEQRSDARDAGAADTESGVGSVAHRVRKKVPGGTPSVRPVPGFRDSVAHRVRKKVPGGTPSVWPLGGSSGAPEARLGRGASCEPKAPSATGLRSEEPAPREPKGAGAAWTEERGASPPRAEGRVGVWTDERGACEE
jgi:hypothetical protein